MAVSKEVIDKIIKGGGIRPTENPEITERFLEYISDSITSFPEFFIDPIAWAEDSIITIIGFCVGYQEGEAEFTDGRCFGRFRYNSKNEKLETQHIICVKEDAVRQGREYTILVLWHELCHCFVDTDNPVIFHAMLDGLLKLYERRTGEHIENDYCEPV